jgi:hypothetical protein
MNDDSLQRLKSLRNLPSESQDDSEEDVGMFGFLRGLKERSPMLELRLKTGNAVALNYAWLERADYDPSKGITLLFGSQTVRLQGTKLNDELRPAVRLFEGILRQRVVWVRESDVANILSKAAQPVVKAIAIE